MSGSQKREAKSLQILLSLKRVEKHSLLRKDVLKPSAAAAMPEVGEYFCLPNKFCWSQQMNQASLLLWMGLACHHSGFQHCSPPVQTCALAVLAFPMPNMALEELRLGF